MVSRVTFSNLNVLEMKVDISENQMPTIDIIVLLVLIVIIVLIVQSPIMGSFRPGQDTVIRIVGQLNGPFVRNHTNAAEEGPRSQNEQILTSTVEQKCRSQKRRIDESTKRKRKNNTGIQGKLTHRDILLNEIPKMRPGKSLSIEL